jgi:hypothetical protein
MRPKHLLTGLVGVALLVLAVGCGSGGTTGSGQAASDAPPGQVSGVAREDRRGAGSNPEPGLAANLPNATVPALRTDPSAGSCDVTITGNQNIKYTAPGGPSAAGSDYWSTPDELRTALRQLTRAARGNISDAEVEREVNEAMQRDPRLFVLIVNCVSAGNSISLLPGGNAKYADVPFAPKRYVIGAGGPLGAGAKTGEFAVLMTLQGVTYQVEEAGTLNITKFDASGIAGTFSFKAAEFQFGNAGGAAKKVTVDARFDYKCTGQSVCRR